MQILSLDLAGEFDNVAGEFFADGFSYYDDGLGDGLGEGLVYELYLCQKWSYSEIEVEEYLHVSQYYPTTSPISTPHTCYTDPYPTHPQAHSYETSP